MYLCEYGVVELRPWRRQGGLVRGAGVAAEGAAVPLHDPGCHGALSVQVGRQSVPVLQADLEDLNFFDFGDQQQVVQGLDIADSFSKDKQNSGRFAISDSIPISNQISSYI